MFGFGYDLMGSYDSVLIAAAALFLVGVVSQVLLGRLTVPSWETRQA